MSRCVSSASFGAAVCKSGSAVSGITQVVDKFKDGLVRYSDVEQVQQ